jgi:hypothetical protein
MTSVSSAMRPGTVCFSCGSAIQPERFWVNNEGLFCDECARRRRIEYIRRNEAVYQRKLREHRTHRFPETNRPPPEMNRSTRRPDRSRHG